ncbi:MAG: amino acid ABC transporter permease [Propionibacteriales bacterium]|nr:amino acid ABC transporter permease [Propionibacteriales bacterium]
MSDWVRSARQAERVRYRRKRTVRRGAVAAVSTALVLVGLVVLTITAPGWERVQMTYFDVAYAREVLPDLSRAFVLNVKLFLVAEIFVLAVAVLVALVRVVPSAAMTPLKLIAIGYTDVFRGTPTLLVIFVVYFGLPALQLEGVPTDLFWLGVIALTLSYGAYVAEVIRAGIASVHPSQWAAGRSLGLTYPQTMRHVVLPQALRRVVPPLINDFVSLQKDTALVSLAGLVEVLRAAQINSSRDFNFTPYVVAAIFFIVLTVPLARLADWLSIRQVRREQGGG